MSAVKFVSELKPPGRGEHGAKSLARGANPAIGGLSSSVFGEALTLMMSDGAMNRRPPSFVSSARAPIRGAPSRPPVTASARAKFVTDGRRETPHVQA